MSIDVKILFFGNLYFNVEQAVFCPVYFIIILEEIMFGKYTYDFKCGCGKKLLISNTDKFTACPICRRHYSWWHQPTKNTKLTGNDPNGNIIYLISNR